MEQSFAIRQLIYSLTGWDRDALDFMYNKQAQLNSDKTATQLNSTTGWLLQTFRPWQRETKVDAQLTSLRPTDRTSEDICSKAMDNVVLQCNFEC